MLIICGIRSSSCVQMKQRLLSSHCDFEHIQPQVSEDSISHSREVDDRLRIPHIVCSLLIGCLCLSFCIDNPTRRKYCSAQHFQKSRMTFKVSVNLNVMPQITIRSYRNQSLASAASLNNLQLRQLLHLLRRLSQWHLL